VTPIVLRFNDPEKATEAAAKFLKLRGGRMSYLKLIKLLYLLDREALLRWGRPSPPIGIYPWTTVRSSADLRFDPGGNPLRAPIQCGGIFISAPQQLRGGAYLRTGERRTVARLRGGVDRGDLHEVRHLSGGIW
jgi:hypothetical protein